MRILQMLTYYRPWISGLTIYAERLARGLAANGHQVTILTSQHEKSLAREAYIDGVRTIRVPVLTRVSKGVLMPEFGPTLRALLPKHDVAHIHLPQFDGAGISINARRMGVPSLLTHHSDIRMPAGGFNWMVQGVIDTANRVALRYVDRVVVNSEDNARHSTLLTRHLGKVRAIPPPIEMPLATAAEAEAFRARWDIGDGPVIGMASRLAAEKGAEVLAQAMPRVLEVFPKARVIHVGPYEDVVGEAAYAARIHTLLADQAKRYGRFWTFAGPQPSFSPVFANLDVLAVPSLNKTETFAMVQAEAMLCGVPVVGSDLPGVRTVSQVTGMGLVVPIGDAAALAGALITVIRERARFIRPRAEVEAQYSTARTVREYELLYSELLNHYGRTQTR
jgi:glycosyltransferase involved in cell wall biosynthesis